MRVKGSVKKEWIDGVCVFTLGRNDPRHGTLNGYQKYKCRCDRCRKAASVYSRQEARERAEREGRAYVPKPASRIVDLGIERVYKTTHKERSEMSRKHALAWWAKVRQQQGK